MTGIVVGGVFVLGIVLLGLALWKSGGDGNGTAVKIATFEEQLSERLGQASGQVKMLLDVADWCRSQKKTDRENEVLGKILEIDSDHTAARSRLGFRQLDGSWVDDETFRQMEKDRAVFQEALGDEVLTLRTKHFLLGTSSAQEAAGSEWLKKVGDRFEEVLTTYYSRWKRDFSSELKIRKLSAIPRRTIVIYPDAASYKKHAIGIEKSYGNTVAFVEADSKVLYTLKYGDFLALPPVHDMLLNTLYFEWDKKERNHVFSLRGLEGLRLVGFDSTLYRSEHFLVAIQNSKGYSSIAALENYTQILEELYVEFYKIVGASISIEPVTVEMPMFIFKNKTEYVNYGKKTGKGNLLGMAEGHYEPKYRRMMTFKADVEDRKSTVLHEGTHLLFHHVARFNHSKMLWFNEGVADYFSGYRLEKGRLVLGFPPNRKRASHLKQLVAMSLRRKKAPPIKSILAYSYLQRNILLGSGKPQQRILQEMQQVYIYSWGLVHFFMHGENEKYRKRFLEYMSDELKGKSGPAAFQTRFSGVDLKTLTQEFIVHVRNLK
jgi:hypothetical protein